jgi:hypothetical protein
MRALSLALLFGVLAGCASAMPAPAGAARGSSPGPEIARRPVKTEPAEVRRDGPNPVLDRAIAAALTSESSAAAAPADSPGAPLPALIREASPPSDGEPAADTGARLPPESIQRVVRASSGRFRACYQRALGRNAKASGQIVTLFVIGAEGQVDLVQEEQSTLSDRVARECVQRAYFELSFPRPPGRRPITVIYPMRFGLGPSAPLDLPHARHVAEPPPPGFAERFRSGVPVPPDPVVMPFEDAAPPDTSRCASGDPMCSEL